MDHSIFYISHFVEPYILYCLTHSYFLPIILVVLWELLEYAIYTITGNYSILYLETENSVMESMSDILLYDIGGGILSVFIAYTLYHIFEIKDIVLELKLANWCKFCLFIIKVLLTSPLAAIGWDCNETTSAITAPLCPDDDNYHLFAWGLIGIIPINGFFIYYMFKADSKQMAIAFAFPIIIMATALQRGVYGILISLWIIAITSVLFMIYWLYTFVRRQRDKRYSRLL